jgi:hypothetical protein
LALDSNGEEIVGNYRNIQDLAGRTVIDSFDNRECAGFSNDHCEFEYKVGRKSHNGNFMQYVAVNDENRRKIDSRSKFNRRKIRGNQQLIAALAKQIADLQEQLGRK